MVKKAVMALSGGMDSTTMLAWLLDQGYEVEVCHFQYGSKHNPYEKEAATRVAAYYGVALHEVDLSSIMSQFKSALLAGQVEIPEGHYSEETMSQTVVPARNIIFLSIVSGFAWSVGASYVALGIHQGDHAIYPDCRKEFYKAMDAAVYLGTDRRVELIAPFVEWDKAKILEWGIPHGVPYELTRTCYKDQPVSCGRCGACVERQEAFWMNSAVDPVPYEDSEYWKSVSELYRRRSK